MVVALTAQNSVTTSITAATLLMNSRAVCVCLPLVQRSVAGRVVSVVSVCGCVCVSVVSVCVCLSVCLCVCLDVCQLDNS